MKLKSTMGLGKMMDFILMFFNIVTITLVLNFSPSAHSHTFVNLADILSSPNVQLHSFLNLLQKENVIEILQTQANTQTGLTLFAPTDAAIARDNVPWGNLSIAQCQSLLLSHALPKYFNDMSSGRSALCQLSPVTTMAGGQYTLSITSVLDTLCVNVSGSSRAQVLNAVNVSTYPTQVYQIDKVLMPEAIFGTNSPPAPAPPTTPATATVTAPSVSTNSTPHHRLSSKVIAEIATCTGGVVVALLVAACIKCGFCGKKKVPDVLPSSERDVELRLEPGRGGESQLPNQPQGASDGDENANTRGGVSTGPTTIGGGIHFGRSKIGAPVSFGTTITNFFMTPINFVHQMFANPRGRASSQSGM